MPDPPVATLITAELARQGRRLVGEPYFIRGLPIPLDANRLGHHEPGELVLLRVGRGRPQLERGFGSAKRIDNVLEALLVERGALTDFEPFELPQPTLADRVDLRELTTLTIDPDTAKDFDDALSFRREADGIRAWVHIADVSAYVPSGSPLDLGASMRAFSTYVPGLVAPMLPHELADDACSLRPHRDRLCITVEMPPGEQPVFYRSVINSDARLTYGQAERREAPPQILEQISLAGELATELRRARFERGALEITTPELSFSFKDGRVAAAALQSEPWAHMLVEELMIRANEDVAAFLASRGRRALYRVHEPPEPRAIANLVERLAALDVPTPPLPETLSPQEAARYAGAVSRAIASYVASSGRGRESFPTLVLRALKQARYDPQNLGHAGLASVAYCHFTSPIRRYPDLVIHRALVKELGLADEALPHDLDALAEHVSLREREAASLEYLADDICLAWLLEDTLKSEGWESTWEGEITGMIGSGLFVRFGAVFEGMLPARNLPGEYYELNDSSTALTGRRSGRAFRLGDAIAVRVDSIARGQGKVELVLAESARRKAAPTPARSAPKTSRPKKRAATKGRRKRAR